MKKTKFILMFIISILFLSSTSFADKDGNISVSMNGGNVQVRQVPIILDGKTLASEVPSFIYVDRTMVPIRMVAENYGADVGWDQKTKTATVTYEDKKIDLTIDSPMANINEERRILDKNSIPRLVAFSEEYANTMVPLAFVSDVLGYEVGYDEEERVPFINSKPEELEEDIEETPEENPEDNSEEDIDEKPEKIPAKGKVENIKIEVIEDKKAIVVYGKELEKYNTMSLNNPDRYVIDFLDASLEMGDYFEGDANAGFVNKFRASQFSPDKNYESEDNVVRLVLDIKKGATDPKFKIIEGKDKFTIFPEESSWKNIRYYTERTDRFLEITNKENTKYSTKYFEDRGLLQINIPSQAEDLKEGKIVVKDGLIDNIDIIKNTNEAVVFVSFAKDVEHSLLSKERDDKILLKFKRDSNIPIKDRVIVIDPGHGGSQPGAISPNGIKEKDINLKVSLKTRDRLRDLGYNVLMTREDDSTLGLYERVDFANDNNADLFISFHANAYPNNSEINGVEILYCPALKGDKNKVDQYPFAKSILDFFIKGTGANNRGIIQRPDLPVVRMTKMPAVLIEVGYMTNAKEEKLILDDEYQNKIADSVINGIENYFEIY